MTAVRLTAQQQAIVNHNFGPALVFAVAGAGKTTAMVQRIARLIREGIFAPQQILATSFNKAANSEIEKRLKAHPQGNQVQVKTLHALGYLITRGAQRRGYLRQVQLDQALEGIEQQDRQLLYKTLTTARQRKVRFANELNRLDLDDFLTYLGACKGNLRYANLATAQLPAQARRIAQQARAPAALPWYLDLYQLYEETRQAQGQLTFDDMLMTGWEMLVKHADLLAELRQQYQCVLVDEYQDINLAQAEILDLITEPQRHYMAIGDDDQTIYEWRGANPNFILQFEQRYQAQVYYMTENFRCPAGPVALANRVIEQNQTRQPKRMGLTQGFDGVTHLQLVASPDAIGQAIGQTISAALRQNYTANDMAVLVRIYAQTPPIEQALIASQIPYEIVGSEPFYQRAEVRTLLDYCLVAQLEDRLSQPLPLTAAERQQFKTAWLNIYNQPTRYLTRALAEKIADFALNTPMPISRAISAAGHELTERVRGAMHKLAEDLKWLSGAYQARAKPSAYDWLQQLEGRLQYTAYLKASSSFAETGNAKAANVAAFINYARNRGSLPRFEQHLEQLAAAHTQVSANPQQPKVTLTSMFRAKGLEWPLVFVPNCNQGTIPYERGENLEEERRLLYVAITRARRALYLYALRNQPLSVFLADAQATTIVQQVATIQHALQSDPGRWRAEEMIALAVGAQRLHLSSYFRDWWNASADQQKRIATLALRILDSLTQHQLAQQVGMQPQDRELWQTLAER